MTTASLTLAPPGATWFAWGRRQSLKAELAELGIPTLPKELVQEHKRAMLADSRFGVWRYLWPLPTLIWATIRICFGTSWRFAAVAAALMVGGLLLAAGVTPVLGIVLVAVGGFPFAAIATLIVFFLLYAFVELLDEAINPNGGGRLEGIIVLMETAAAAASYWHPVSLKWAVNPLQMPGRLQERAHNAGRIPGVRVVVLALDDDPILEARRGFLGWDREVIGAWGTGVPALDRQA